MKKLLQFWFNYENIIFHFILGYLASSLIQSTGHLMILGAIIVGLWKEFSDMKNGGKFSLLDFVVTFAGGFTAYFMVLVSHIIGYFLPGLL